MNNYADALALARSVIKLAVEEMSRGMPNPTCGMTCYKLAVALLHAETVRARAALRSVASL